MALVRAWHLSSSRSSSSLRHAVPGAYGSVLCRRLRPAVSVAAAQSIAPRWFSDNVQKRKFVDRVRLTVAGGRGGRGCVAWEAVGLGFKKRASGGNGGVGGDVIVKASDAVTALSFQTYVFHGKDGNDASGSGCHGRKGKDCTIIVPRGTVIKSVVRYDPMMVMADPAAEFDSDADEYDSDDQAPMPTPGTLPELPEEYAHLKPVLNRFGQVNFYEDIQVLADLDHNGDSLVVARGGQPGMGNMSLKRFEQAPDTPHVVGATGEQQMIELELKTIADVGLVGFPNAGKSTFLAAVSRAKPKIASYPFTTLHPNVGIITFPDAMRISIADIPGLIEGAHENRGLGHDFLRHIERTKVLLFIVDVSAEADHEPVGTLKALINELQMYDPALLKKPAAVVANKMDLPGAAENVQRLRAATKLPVMCASAFLQQDVGPVINAVRFLIEAAGRQRQRRASK